MSDVIANAVVGGALVAIRRASARYAGRRENVMLDDLAAAIEIMRDDHDAHGERLSRLAQLTNGHTPPADACGTWRALTAGTRKFATDLRAHIDLENDVLFPRFGG